ncbi:MAG: two-component regulator propeller domain-containing protein [Saprospiraceae bacterium]
MRKEFLFISIAFFIILAGCSTTLLHAQTKIRSDLFFLLVGTTSVYLLTVRSFLYAFFRLVWPLVQRHWLSFTLRHPQSLGIRSLWITGVLIFTFQSLTFAQQPAQFKAITQKDGLSNDFIRCLFEDHNGFIWIGTENGLNRYDGYQITVFKNDPNFEGSLQGSWINNIYEDSNNNIWVGTDKGLNLFNAKSAKIELIDLNADSISSTIYQVQSIQEDKWGNLWVGTRRSGIKCLYKNGEQWRRKKILTEADHTFFLNSEQIAAMLIDNNDNLWITSTTGIYRLNIPTGKLEKFASDPPIPIPQQFDNFDILSLDQKGRVIVGTGLTGIYRIEHPNSSPLNTSHDRFLYNPQSQDFKNVSFSQKKISDLIPTKDDMMWVGTKDGLYNIDVVTEDIVSYKHDPFRQHSLSSNRVEPLLIDKDQNLWVGTLGGGVNLLPHQSTPFQQYFHQPEDPGSISTNQVRSMVIDDAGFLWVGTLGSGLDKMEFDPDKGWQKVQNIQGDIINNKGLSSNDIIQIIKAQSGNLWVAANEGNLVEFDPISHQTKVFKQSPNSNISVLDTTFDYRGIWSLCEDHLGNIWIGTRSKGVHKLNPRSGTLKSYSTDSLWSTNLSNKHIYNIYEDHFRHIWFCTANGLYRFDSKKNELQEFLHDPNNINSISDSWIWTVAEDSQHNIWVGTNNGLNLYDIKTGQFQRFYETHGLPSNVVWGVVQDDQGNLWVSTDAGLARGIYKLGEKSVNNSDKLFRPFTSQSGLLGDSFLPHAYFKNDKTGHLFFGGLHGFNIFHPKQIILKPTEPRMVLSTFSVSSRSKDTELKVVDYFISDKEKIQLNHLDDILTISFSDLQYQAYGNNKFEYQLLGLSEQWIPLEENKTMTFIDLPPGAYYLNMRGSSPSGLIIKKKMLLEIDVLPPWWKSWWAYALYILSIIGIVVLGYRFQLKRQLEVQESQRLKDLDRFKTKMYTNITHEFRTPLTVISGITDQISAHENEKSLIKRNSNQLLNLVNQMLDLRKLESGEMQTQMKQGDIIRFLRYITESLHSLAEISDIELHFLCDMQELIMDFDCDKMTRIITNLLSNAIKFTPLGGNIYFHIEQDYKSNPTQLIIKLRDTGIGITEEQLPHIFDRFYQVDDSSTRQGEGTGIGLTLVKEMVLSLSGNIEVASLPSKGTTFTICLPFTNVAEGFYDKASLTTSQIKIDVPIDLSNTDIESTLVKHRQGLDGKQKETILIAEDNPDVIHYLVVCLKEEYIIEIAMNGAEGIDKAIDIIPDLIISDVMMPEKDGLELCETLKSDERTSHVPIILLTAKADYKSRIEGLKRGADAYLAKPFDKKELLVEIEKLISLRKSLQFRYEKLDLQHTDNLDVRIEDAFVTKFREVVEEHLDDANFVVIHIARALHISRSQLQRKIRVLTSKSCAEFQRYIRLHKAKTLLSTTDLSISEIAYDVGFQYLSSFSKAFSAEFGTTPTQYREGVVE